MCVYTKERERGGEWEGKRRGEERKVLFKSTFI